MAKRKHSAAAAATAIPSSGAPPPLPAVNGNSISKQSSTRKVAGSEVNPSKNNGVIDGPVALRASPDGEANPKLLPNRVKVEDEEDDDSALSDIPLDDIEPPTKKARQGSTKSKEIQANGTSGHQTPSKKKAAADPAVEAIRGDPDADDVDEPADPDEIQEALSRPPPINSSYLPLPWKGRIGYACLCTYLRYSNPPVFQSRTTRIASILEHRHPLRDPSQPEHATKNRADKDKPAEIWRGQEYVEKLCIANCRDMVKMLRWNDKYGIKFLRLSSEAFPFASHAEYGYKLAPFASEALAAVGKVVAELGHRVTTHPGQFTQLGSPRKQVIDASFKDLEYHDEMLSLLKLPPQQNRDAVMVLHMGGVFGDKEATLDRFRENYARLSPSIKNRLVLENDDMSWSVHDLLPICQELNIPMVLDFHHHNIVFNKDKIREGTEEIRSLFPAIKATWDRKNITQKMHYSEPTPPAITPKQRRKHNPRVASLPPCPPDMDLMIEAKDKEQAVFELMRTFKLPGHELFNDIIPHVRNDDNKSILAARKKAATPKKPKGRKAAADSDEESDEQDIDGTNGHDSSLDLIPEDEVGMGGPQNRVYWPPSMEEWLRPMKKVVAKRDPGDSIDMSKGLTPAQRKQAKSEAEANYLTVHGDAAVAKAEAKEAKDEVKKEKAEVKKEAAEVKKEKTEKVKVKAEEGTSPSATAPKGKGAAAKGKAAAPPPTTKKAAAKPRAKKVVKEESMEETPSAEDEEVDDDDADFQANLAQAADEVPDDLRKKARKAAAARANGVGAGAGAQAPKLARRQSKRAKVVDYGEDGDEGSE